MKRMQLIQRLMELVFGGAFTDQEIAAFIAGKQVTDSADQRLVYWETHFPGYGEALMDVLRPLYDWDPKLNPVYETLEKDAIDAIFWVEPDGALFYPPEQFDILYHQMEVPLWGSFKASTAGLMADTLGADQPKLRGLLRDSLWDELEPKFRNNIKQQIMDAMKQLGWAKIIQKSGEALWVELWDSYALRLALSLGEILFYACGFVLHDRPQDVARLKKLIALYLRGTIPMGFGMQRKVLILTA